MAKRKIADLEPWILITACERFLQGGSAPEAAKWFTAYMQERGRPEVFTREDIWPMMFEARKQGYIVLRAPREEQLQEDIARFYGYLENDDTIEVVKAEGFPAIDLVAERAAKRAVELIKKVGETKQSYSSEKKAVHLGLGAGFTTLNIVRHLAHDLRAERCLPDLVVHALTSGFKVDEPEIAPVSFFRSFDNLGVNVRYVGLFATAVVESAEYSSEIRNPGVAEAFARRDQIDIVITSLASAKDEHGDLNQFLEHRPADIALLNQYRWVGDVQYRPYSEEGPLPQDASIRAVTLFELSELIALAKVPNKYILVVSGPCGQCHRSRADALRPLLRVPELKVWTHVVMDRKTAESLLPPEQRTRKS